MIFFFLSSGNFQPICILSIKPRCVLGQKWPYFTWAFEWKKITTIPTCSTAPPPPLQVWNHLSPPFNISNQSIYKKNICSAFVFVGLFQTFYECNKSIWAYGYQLWGIADIGSVFLHVGYYRTLSLEMKVINNSDLACTSSYQTKPKIENDRQKNNVFKTKNPIIPPSRWWLTLLQKQRPLWLSSVFLVLLQFSLFYSTLPLFPPALQTL